MGPNPQIPKISIGRHAQRDIRAWMNTDIGIASREVVADEQFLIALAIVVDFGCWSQHHDCAAMRAAQRPLCSIRIPSFFQNNHLLFAFYPEFTQKGGGYPPSLRKEICKHFVNGQKKSYCKENAIALETKYRVLWLGHMGFETLSQTCYGLIGIAQISTF